MQRRWEDHLGRYIQSGFELSLLQQGSGSVVQLLQRLMSLGILVLGVQQVMAQQLTVGQLIAFNMITGQFTAPVLRLASLWHELQQTLLGLERLADVVNQPSEVDEQAAASLSQLKGELRFQDVRFQYRRDRPPVLDGINLTDAFN